ncbi:high light inducible protein [filamentous cyanobacterium LEGE 11480]|uniref:High light inducible protein n=1 Tax=Romeriopsis navalis LEGE 11480 TaxID=2777977 RepID=A0A928VKR1_9CYAN|nr:chlorophyll a/b-binding protein [Romeriopsis navalis]MBE9028162.1 high light inducible protein [Romeriopsis navalis LEGE 11480]
METTAKTDVTVRQEITAHRNAWRFGFTPSSELWNGRFAMIGFIAAIITEILTGQGTLQFLGLM